MTTFLELAGSGEVALEAIDDYVDAWHDGEADQSLHEWLGLTPGEYDRWVRDPAALADIVLQAKRAGRISPGRRSSIHAAE